MREIKMAGSMLRSPILCHQVDIIPSAVPEDVRDIIAHMLPDLEINDVIRLRKPHPCGGYEWKVVRLGADIGIVCLKCGRRVLIPRRELSHRIKTIYPKTDEGLLST